jgi:AcrR family transcriptional regulator
MSPRTRITREQWLAAMSGLLADGLAPADLPLSDLCERLGVTKGSFYSHFPGGVEELHREIIDRWARESDLSGLASAMHAIVDPRDRLRLLRARALESAQRDGAMRRWGARYPAAAAAVAQADAEVTGHVDGALRDLGLAGADSGMMADVLVHAFIGAHHTSSQPPLSNPARLERLLDILTRAAVPAVAQAEGAVDVAAGSAPDEVVLFTIAQGLPSAARKELRDQAQRFAEQASAQGPAGTRSRRPSRAASGRASRSSAS